MTIETMVAAVKAHANAHYEQGGWDYVVECWTDQDIAKKVSRCKSVAGAIKAVGKRVGDLNDYRSDVQGESEAEFERREMAIVMQEEREWAARH